MKELLDLLSNLEGERRLGREEGRKEGIEIGIEKGIQMVAKKLLLQGMDHLETAKVTGLRVEDIKSL